MQVCGSTRLSRTNFCPQSFCSSGPGLQHCVPHYRQQRHSTVVSAAAAASGPFFNRTQTNSIRYGPSKAPTSDPLHTHDSQAAVGPALVNRGLSADPVQAAVALLRSKAHAVDLLIAQNVDTSQMLSAGLLALQFVQLLTVGWLGSRLHALRHDQERHCSAFSMFGCLGAFFSMSSHHNHVVTLVGRSLTSYLAQDLDCLY